MFFVGADGKPHWCSATAIQSQHKNLVATAGHCVYDTKKDKAALDKWVFIPGYYEGKTPWGIYVGKTAYTHFDFSFYHDGDFDYAFVAVYNGVQVTGVSTSNVKDWLVNRVFKTKADALKAQQSLETKYTGWAGRIVPFVSTPLTVVRDKRNKEFKQTAVDLLTWAYWQNTNAQPLAGRQGLPQAASAWETLKKGRGESTNFTAAPGTGVTVTRVSRTEYNSAPKSVNLGGVEVRYTEDLKTIYFPYDNGWYKATFWVNYDVDYKIVGKIIDIKLKDVGRLVDNVGGQGLAYNQKLGQPVFVFGYPSGSHPDGNYAFTGKTLKWSYGKPSAYQAPAEKAENLQGIRSSFTGEGALGSAWLLKYSNATRLGYLNGVTIGVADTDGNQRYDTSVSPYFDGETLQVYQAAATTPSGSIV